MPVERTNPYIWVTWLTKLLVGENSCEWAAWFRSRHETWSYEKVPSTFDATTWQLNHTALLNRIQTELEDQGQAAFTENQNFFNLKGNVATLGGKPDLITVDGNAGTIFDAKTGKPSPSHHIQVMAYMYAVPRALGQYKGVTFEGKVVYEDQEVSIPSASIDGPFVDNLSQLIRRVASSTPARKVPSQMECGFWNLTTADCPERAASDTMQEGETSDF